MTFGLSGAALTAALAAVGEAAATGAAAAAPALGAAGAGAGTAAAAAPAVGGALAAAPAIAEGAAAAAPAALEAAAPAAIESAATVPSGSSMGLDAAMGPSSSTGQFPNGIDSPYNVPNTQPMSEPAPAQDTGGGGMGLDDMLGLGPIKGLMKGDIGEMLKPPGMDMLFGGGDSAQMPAPEPLPGDAARPATPYVPTQQRLSQAMGGSNGDGWRKNLNIASQALGLANTMTTNKNDKKTLALMQAATGMGAANDAESTMKALSGPLSEIGKITQESQKPKEEPISPLASPLPQASSFSPSPKQPLPEISAGGGQGMSLTDRLRMIRGY